jgi:hypothetical protein
MSAGQRANIIQLRLANLRNIILPELSSRLASSTVPTVDKSKYSKYEDLVKKISAWKAELESISKEMRSTQNSLQFEGSRVRGLRREHRFSQQQSVHDRQKHVQHTQEFLKQIGLELALLWGKLQPTDIDAINGFVKVLESNLKDFQKLKELEQILVKAQFKEATTAMVEVSSYIPNASNQVQPGGMGFIAIFIVMLRLWQILALSMTTHKD